MTGRTSLNLRLSLAAALSIIVALTLSGYFLLYLFERHVTRRVDQELLVYVKQLAATLEINAQDRPLLAVPLADARFERPLSGLYWQIEDANLVVLRSRSLWDQTLALPKLDPTVHRPKSYEITGPDGEQLVARTQTIFLQSPTGDRAFRLAAALNTKEIRAAKAAFTDDLLWALGLLGLTLLIASGAQIFFGLRPLGQIRQRINDVRTGAATRLEGAFPKEVQSLVTEVNALMAANDQAVARARDSAADLAHGLKTPLAVMQAEGRRLAEKNETEAADEISEQVEQMRLRVERHLAAVRMKGQSTGAVGRTNLQDAFEKIINAMRTQPGGDALKWDMETDNEMTVAMDSQDFFEVFGNILDNARKWAAGRVGIRAEQTDDATIIEICDDGPGVPEEKISDILRRGRRLDEQKTGAGLGLAIAMKVLDAYGADILLNRNIPTGLKISVSIPVAYVSTAKT